MNIGKIIEDLEVRRKIFHLLAILLWLLPLYFFPTWLTVLLFFLVLLINLLTVLKAGEKSLKLYYKMVYSLEREKNYKRPGIQALWANVGICLSFLFFGKYPAMVSVVVLAVGDALASIVGIKYGRRKIWGTNRSLEGTTAFFLFSFLVLLPFLGFVKALIVSFSSALVEALPLKLDDNFTVPVVAGLVYYLMCGL